MKRRGVQEAHIGTVMCPACGHLQRMVIPTASCQAFYRCEGCEKMIKAERSCCVFCDYGDRPCPAAKEHKK